MSYKNWFSALTLITCASPIVAAAEESSENTYPNLNSTQIGIQNITYKESLAGFAGIGTLSTEADMTNTVLYASTYTHLHDNWGFWLNTQSNINKEYAEDEWILEGYGPIQTNTNKINVSDLTVLGVNHIQREYFASFGIQLKTLQFVRSNFEGTGDYIQLNQDIRNSDQYFQDPNPPQIVSSPLAIEEDQTYVNGVVGINYNSAFAAKRRPLTFHASATFALPLYVTAQNSSIQEQYGVDSIDDSFHGYEVRLNGGISYEFKQGLAVTLDVNYSMHTIDEMNVSINDEGIQRTAAIPEIEYASTQFTLGILWIN